jgi:stage V sporulation protein R
VRESLSRQYDLGSREPNIQVWNVNLRGDRSLTLRHFQHNDRPLHDTAQEVLKHVARLWGFGVHLESVNAKGDVTKRWTVPAKRARLMRTAQVFSYPASCFFSASIS